MPASVSLCFIPDSMAEQSLKDKTAKGLLWGGISNGVQQLLNLAFGIFLARILTPADYGMVGMLAIFTAIAGTLQDSGFTSALLLVQFPDRNHPLHHPVFQCPAHCSLLPATGPDTTGTVHISGICHFQQCNGPQCLPVP